MTAIIFLNCNSVEKLLY